MKKLAIGVVGLFLVAMLALFFWARAILGTEAVRAALAGQISQALGQPVVIGGLSATIYPRVGITLNDVAVGGASSITARALKIEADLRALLSRRIEHATLRLDGARVVLPLPALTRGAATNGRATTTGAPVELVSIDEVALRGVEIVSDGHVLRGDIEVVPRGSGLLVKSITLAAGAMTLRATGEIADLAGPVGELSLAAGTLNFDEMVGLAEAFSRNAAPPAASALPAPPALPSTMRVGIVMTADRATLGGMTIENVDGRALVTGNEVAIDPLAFGLFGGRYEGTLRIRLDTTPPTFRWNARVQNIDVAAAAAFAGSPDTISGRLAARVDLLGEGENAATAMKSVRGNARVEVTDGSVKHLGLVRSVGAATKLTVEGLRAATTSGASTDEPFSKLGATIMLSEGTASTSDLEFEAADLSLSASGTARLDASALNLTGRLLLSEPLSRQVRHTFLRMSQEEGRVVLPATITGPAAAPIVRIDTANITRRALRNVATEGAPKLLKGVGGILRK